MLECYRRSESIVPQQALALSNSKLALKAADAIAGRVNGGTDEAFVAEAFALVLGFTPTEAETKACRDAMREWREGLAAAKHPDPVRKARVNLVAALLNHNDFVTVR